MAKNMNDVGVIRRFILDQTKPFCLVDLYNRAERVGITDARLVTIVLDELGKEGLIDYGEIEPESTNPEASIWAYHIAG
jgi:hypothetical protein